MPPSTASRRITLVIPSLGAGGAERVVAMLSRAWAERGWVVRILTFDDGRAPSFYPLHPAVVWQPLALAADSGGSVWRGLANNLRRLRVLRTAITSAPADIVVSFIDQTNILVLLALIGAGRKVAVWENTDPLAARTYAPVSNWGRRLARFIYPLAAAVVAQTETAGKFLAQQYGDRAVGIPNPILAPAAVAPLDLQRPAVIALGRLSPEKGFDILLRAFARIAPRFPEWRLYIFGDGPDRPRLEGVRESLGLADRTQLPGAIAEPTAALRAGDLFAVASHIEGFSLALGEALACGLPAVATDCSSGPRTVLRDGYDGLLVPPGNEEALAEAMAKLMADPALRSSFAARAPDVLTRFSLTDVLARWDALFDRIETGKR